MDADATRSPLLRVARRLLPASRRQRLRRALFDWLQLSWTTRQGIHLRVGNYNEWIVYNEIFVDGEYDPAIQLALDRHATNGPLQVIDLGANVGFFTLRAFDRVRAAGLTDAACHVTLVEADPAIVPVLDRRVRCDNAVATQVRLVHGAVGADAGMSTFYRSRVSPGDGSLLPAANAVAVSVPVIDLDQVLADTPALDLVKCDIEGAELSLLEKRPGWLQKTAIIVIEIHSARSPVERCRAALAAAGLTHETVLRSRNGYELHLYARE